MDLQVVYNQLLFWVNLKQGGWYPPEELDAIVDKGQLSYLKDCYIKYGTSQRYTDALAPFKKRNSFVANSVGVMTKPGDYMHLIAISPEVNGKPVSCPMLNGDEITYRVNSQVIPNTTSNPFAEREQIAGGLNFQLYPKVAQSGTISFFARPVAPKFSYTLVSGRVIVYNQFASVQLAWPDDEIQPLLIWTLQSIGINLSEPDVSQFAETKSQQNFLSTIKI